MFKRSSNGFTLVELLVVIAILAILATVTVVGYTSFIKKSAISVDEDFVAQLNKFKIAYKIKNGNIDENNLEDMLSHTGIKELNLSSEKYGYAVYFNTSNQKFELLETKHALNNLNLIMLHDSMFNAMFEDDENTEDTEDKDDPSAPGNSNNNDDNNEFDLCGYIHRWVGIRRIFTIVIIGVIPFIISTVFSVVVTC